MIIAKKSTAHNGEIGSCNVADGYARNAKPEPIKWQNNNCTVINHHSVSITLF